MRKNWEYWRGDVYLANLDPVVGAEIGGIRPVLILQNNTGNFFSPMVILEQLKTLDKRRIIKYLGRVDSSVLYSPEFCKCLAVSLALYL